MKYIVNLSGGKDSTAMLLMLLEKRQPIDYIVFADTGKDFPQMRAHIERLAEYIKKHYPAAPEITPLKADKTFDYLMFEHIKTKGKRQGSAGYGWATMLARWCTAQLKTAVINKFCNALGDDYMHYIGIAVDEPKRLKPDSRKLYPLADWNITEAAQGNEQLNALIGKSVFIEFNNGAAAFGFLHQTIVSAGNNKNYLVRYYVEMPTRRVYFESADVKTIREY